MTEGFPRSMKKLVDEFSKMPGIGIRSAERLTSYILQAPQKEINELIHNINEVKDKICFCRECNNLSEEDICSICSDTARDSSVICVVEGTSGVIALEKSGTYKGLYHVLLGELSPIDGVGPEELKINELVARVKNNKVSEVIIATNFTTEGETTALYIQKLLKQFKIKITRLARGVPMGGSLEYADMATLQRALEDRK